MEVKVEKKDAQKERAHEYIEAFFEKVKIKKGEFATFVKNDFIPYLSALLESIKDSFGDYMVIEEVDVLDRESLYDIAKQYIVPNANQVVTYRVNKDEYVIVYLTYCYNNEPLPKDKNKLVIIRAEAMNKAAKDLFKDSDLVILT